MSLTLSDCLDQHLEMRGEEIEMKVGVGRQPLLEGGGRGRRREAGREGEKRKGNEERTGARDAARRVSAGERFLFIFYFSI